jgi:glycosyltransferase involved in cell wall biosynthesis
MTHLVSAIIPVFNRERTIARAVTSALEQSYANLEVIVVDDGSQDGTLDALEQFGNRISVFTQPNGGPSRARNLGASKSSGTILAFLDSDDEWLPHKIEKQVSMMQAYGRSMPCCVCNARYGDIDRPDTHTSFELAGLSVPYETAILENPVQMLTGTFLLFNQVAAIRREVFEQVGGFNERLRLMEDYDVSLRIATHGHWGVLRDTLVIKHEDTAGIGVSAMQDEFVHLAAQEAVFTAILSHPQLQDRCIQNPINVELRRAKRRQAVHRWMQGAPRSLRFGGRAVLALDAGLKSLSRRLQITQRARLRQAWPNMNKLSPTQRTRP